MALKRYANVGTTDIRLNKRLTVKAGEETTEFIAIEPSLEKYLINIGAFKVLEEKKSGKDVSAVAVTDPEAVEVVDDHAVSADVDPANVPQALSESQIKEIEKANKGKKK